jgi:hypothetical protein
MKGQTIIPRRANGFEVAHRIEDGEHHFEVAIGSSFNELSWDFSANRFVADPERYIELPGVLESQGAGWLLELFPTLAAGSSNLTSTELQALAAKP